jgi:hypothetical protein
LELGINVERRGRREGEGEEGEEGRNSKRVEQCVRIFSNGFSSNKVRYKDWPLSLRKLIRRQDESSILGRFQWPVKHKCYQLAFFYS